MTRVPPVLAMLAVMAATGANAQAPPASDPKALTFAITLLPPPPVLATPPPPAAAAGPAPPGSWVVSETRSPVDYEPVAIATQVAGTDDGPRLSIQCRGGKAEMLVLLASTATGRETVSLGIDDSPPRPLRVAPSFTQRGVVLGEPVQRLLAGLPDSGSLRLHLAVRGQAEVESHVSLQALAAVRHRLAGPCGWTSN